MKVDLHVHSEFSKRPSNWILQKVGCSESYTDPVSLYQSAKKRGMTAVTITDHNCIEGCREISHLPDTFTGCEVTSYFPEDGCKVHILVYQLSEAQFDVIDQKRENIYELVKYLQAEDLVYAQSHPLYKVNDKFSVEHFEKCLLLFKILELNGDHDVQINDILRQICSELTPEDIELLSSKHGIEPGFEKPWEKYHIGGSDDHSSLTMCFNYTEVPGARTVEQFWEGVRQGLAVVHCPHPGTPLTLAHNLYGVAYQFYNNKLRIGKHHERSVLIRFLDRMLQTRPKKEPALWNQMVYQWKRRKNRRPRESTSSSLSELLQYEAQKLIEGDKGLKSMLTLGHTFSKKPDQHWFRFVNKISNKMLEHLGSHVVHQLSGGNPFDIFHTLGSGGALYTLLAPYFVTFSMYSSDKRFSEEVAGSFELDSEYLTERLSVGHFTDTYHEINGVARMLQEELEMARQMGKDLTLITCPTKPEDKKPEQGLKYFDPVAVHSLPEYPEVKTCVPPLLDMLKYCYDQKFTHIHAATPGPLGLSAIAMAKVLKLPLYTTYHTAIPQYARYLTGDSSIEGLAWRYILWFYDQANIIFVPSKATGGELVERGIAPEKIRVIPRGVDTQKFRPENKCQTLNLPSGLKLLYVGRVSKEKDLPVLAGAFRKLSAKHKDIHLIVVGDGPYLDEMKQTMKGCPCVFTGYLTGDDLTGVFAMSDLFVFPSTTDTFGNVVLEAQASGLPIVVTDKGGPCENLIPGQTGLVVEGGSERAFFEAVNKLISDRDMLKEMRSRAYDYAHGRDYHEAFEQYWQLYQSTPDSEENTPFMQEMFAAAASSKARELVEDRV